MKDLREAFWVVSTGNAEERLKKLWKKISRKQTFLKNKHTQGVRTAERNKRSLGGEFSCLEIEKHEHKTASELMNSFISHTTISHSTLCHLINHGIEIHWYWGVVEEWNRPDWSLRG